MVESMKTKTKKFLIQSVYLKISSLFK
jgi:hypothetical protein